MNPVAIQYIWQAIQDSKRSDDLPFINSLVRSFLPQPDRSGAADREPITAAAEPLRTVTLPLLSRP
jgi:hypothetical protein